VNASRPKSAFVQALKLDSSHVKSHLNLARVLLESGKPDSALSQSKRHRRSTRPRASRCGLQGRAFEAQGKDDDAIVAYQHAIVKDDSDFWAMNNLGALYMRVQPV